MASWRWRRIMRKSERSSGRGKKITVPSRDVAVVCFRFLLFSGRLIEDDILGRDRPGPPTNASVSPVQQECGTEVIMDG